MPKSRRRRWAAPLALAALAVVPASAGAARVTVRVEGSQRTLVPSRTVSTPARPVGLPGRPTCPGASALGALDVAVGGRWSGTWYDGLGYSVESVRGERHGGAPTFFSFWFRDREASVGVCAVRPRTGDQILLFVSRFPARRPIEPLELRAPRGAVAGRPFTVVVRRWSARGVPSRVRGATVAGPGVRVRTNAEGFARIAPARSGRLALRATKPGLVRSETDTVRVAAARATAAVASARAPQVETMIVGPARVLWGPRTIAAPAARLRIGGRSCRARAGSALAVLVAAHRRRGPGFAARTYGSCETPYVRRIGRLAARGANGWVFKVGRRTPATSAAASRRGARVTWFWCRTRAGSCQRTLEVRPDRRTVAPGAPLAVAVVGYDDGGRGRPVAGARVRLGASTVTTDGRGRAVLPAPATAGGATLRAERPGLVPAFPVRVAVR